MSDSRRSTRIRTMLGGQIVFNNRCSTIDCKIRNMSEDGAKIMVDSHMTFPQRFEFHVPQKGRSFHAKVIWRQENETGLAFMEDTHVAFASEPVTGLAARMRELESENAQLKKRVLDLQARIDRDMTV